MKDPDPAPMLALAGDPVRFAVEVLGVTPWTRQAEVLRAVNEHPRVAVRSGHKVGKSLAAAVLALWFVSTRPHARVVMTSASGRQVRSILWREVRRLHRGSLTPLGGTLHASPELGLQLDDGREVVGFSTNEPERMAGISGQSVLFILDEASGIGSEIFEAVEGNRAGGARVAMFSNPTRTSGAFFDAFHAGRPFWHTIHLSSAESPNLLGHGPAVPGLAARPWIEEKRAEWGEASPLYQVRVAGNFPTQAENAVIGLVQVEAAVAGWPGAVGEGRLEIGVDVAYFGDDETVIFPRRGRKALTPIVLRSLDPVAVAGKVLEVVRDLRLPGERPRVKVDVIGYGAGVLAVLAREPEVEAIGVNVANSATSEGFHRLRDQVWFSLADWLKEGGTIPPDSKLEGELVAPVYGFDAQGRRKVESKDELKKRLGRSPDRADALALAIYNPPSVRYERTSTPRRW